MVRTALEAREKILADLATAIDQMALATACLGQAYEQLDELRRPARGGAVPAGPEGFGRAKRTHSQFAERFGLPARAFDPPSPGLPSQGVSGSSNEPSRHRPRPPRRLRVCRTRCSRSRPATPSCEPGSPRSASSSTTRPAEHASSPCMSAASGCAGSSRRRRSGSGRRGPDPRRRRGHRWRSSRAMPLIPPGLVGGSPELADAAVAQDRDVWALSRCSGRRDPGLRLRRTRRPRPRRSGGRPTPGSALERAATKVGPAGVGQDRQVVGALIGDRRGPHRCRRRCRPRSTASRAALAQLGPPGGLAEVARCRCCAGSSRRRPGACCVIAQVPIEIAVQVDGDDRGRDRRLVASGLARRLGEVAGAVVAKDRHRVRRGPPFVTARSSVGVAVEVGGGDRERRVPRLGSGRWLARQKLPEPLLRRIVTSSETWIP